MDEKSKIDELEAIDDCRLELRSAMNNLEIKTGRRFLRLRRFEMNGAPTVILDSEKELLEKAIIEHNQLGEKMDSLIKRRNELGVKSWADLEEKMYG